MECDKLATALVVTPDKLSPSQRGQTTRLSPSSLFFSFISKQMAILVFITFHYYLKYLTFIILDRNLSSISGANSLYLLINYHFFFFVYRKLY